MRIIIDMQGWQASSRNRGIGRYTLSLIKEVLLLDSKHTFILLFNAAFEDSITEFKNEISNDLNFINRFKIELWHPVTPTRYLNSENEQNRNLSETIYRSHIASLKPDFLLLTSLFEGLIDDAVSFLDGHECFTTGVILYDLIPMIYPEKYLSNNVLKEWYDSKVSYLKKADYLFSISESAGSEAIKYLEWDPLKVINISTAADSKFIPKVISKETSDAIFRKFGLNENFLMYTGGWDYRKNIEKLIESYALLPNEMRSKHQLVIVCSIPEENVLILKSLAKSLGLTENQLILTGYVSDEELLTMYNLCHAFVFPSWHEGFGLPVLEAMLCGKAVIASNVSSLPEVLDFEEAQFDPRNINDMADKIQRVLSDDDFRKRIIEHCSTQAQKFSWRNSATKLINSIEESIKYKSCEAITSKSINFNKRKLAFISPLPPEKSGISYYSEELLPYLSEYYDIDVINNDPNVQNRENVSECEVKTVDEFIHSYNNYDRVLYQIGNSHFHAHMFKLIKSHPGIAVMHDFYLSGGIHWLSKNGEGEEFNYSFNDYLYESHGFSAVSYNNLEINDGNAIEKYPCNYPVLENARTVIFHSRYSLNLASEWYKNFPLSKLNVIPLLRIPAKSQNKKMARDYLGLREDDVVIISLGYIAPTKLNDRIIRAYNQANTSAKNTKLVFVGHNPDSDYGRKILSLIDNSPRKESIVITDWVSDDDYKQWLAAGDIGIQLRTMSRGETSAAVLDCMNYGLATIVNANGSMSELAVESVKLLDDEFTDYDLKVAIEDFVNDASKRHEFGRNARQNILMKHSPEHCAKLYYQVIEDSYSNKTLMDNIYQDRTKFNSIPEELLNIFSQSLADTLALPTPHKIYVDVTSFLDNQNYKLLAEFILSFNEGLPKNIHIELVHYDGNEKRFVQSQSVASKVLLLNEMNISDDILDAFKDSIVLTFNPKINDLLNSRSFYGDLSACNKVLIVFSEEDFIVFAKELADNDDIKLSVGLCFKNIEEIVVLDVKDDCSIKSMGYNELPLKNVTFYSTADFVNSLANVESY